jgi:hypothetical protein
MPKDLEMFFFINSVSVYVWAGGWPSADKDQSINPFLCPLQVAEKEGGGGRRRQPDRCQDSAIQMVKRPTQATSTLAITAENMHRVARSFRNSVSNTNNSRKMTLNWFEKVFVNTFFRKTVNLVEKMAKPIKTLVFWNNFLRWI